MIIIYNIMAYEVIRSSAVFGILVMMFITIMVFVYTVEPEVRDDILPPIVIEYDNTLFDVSPGELSAGTITEGVKRIPLNDLDIDNTLQYDELDVVRDASFSSSVFTNEVYDFGFSVDKDKVSTAGIKFLVYDMSGDGKLNIYLNGKTVLARDANLGSTVSVEFPINYIKDGANQIEITTSSPTLTFWSKNSYTLLDVVLFTKEYDTRTATGTQIFSLSASEATNAESVILKAMISPETSSTISNMEIKLNGYRLLKATPPQNFELDIPSTVLKSGANLVEWSTERGGKYTIKFSNILIDTVKTTGKANTYFFTIDDSTYTKVKNDNYECILSLVRDSGDYDVLIELNSNANKFDFVEDKINLDVCDDLNSGRNNIKFSAVDELDLDGATLIVKNK
jgi:hypothetical protein